MKKITCILFCLIAISAMAVNQYQGNFWGNLFGSGDTTNLFLQNPSFQLDTNAPIYGAPITISASTNGYVNGNYSVSSVSTDGLGLVYYTWTNSSTPLVLTNIAQAIESITLNGLLFSNSIPSGYPSSSTIQVKWGGTNYNLQNEYVGKIGSSPYVFLTFDQDGWQIWSGPKVPWNLLQMVNATQNPFSPSWVSNWFLVNGSNAGTLTVSFYLSPIVTNVFYSTNYPVAYVITNKPSLWPATSQLYISGLGSAFAKDSPSENPNGHWTQIAGLGDSNVTGSAVASYGQVDLPGTMAVNNIIVNSITLGGVTYTNLVLLVQNVNNIINGSSVENGYAMSPVSSLGGTNYYWWDFGQQSVGGQALIYATLTASSPTTFIGVTNCIMWGLLSLNVVASGGNRNIQVPDSLPHFNSIGWAHVPPYYSLTLTNGNELRMTIQSNSTLSTTWQTYGQ